MNQFKIDPAAPMPAPIEFAGQWVAWNKGRTDIVAHGRHFAEVHALARAKGFPDAVFQRVRKPTERFVGSL